jgi:hypothetical protein
MNYSIEIPFSHAAGDEFLHGVEAIDARESSRNLRADRAAEAQWLRALGSPRVGVMQPARRRRGARAPEAWRSRMQRS